MGPEDLPVSGTAKVGVTVGLIAVIGVSAAFLIQSFRSEGPKKIDLGWKCSQCGEAFEGKLADDPLVARSERDVFPTRECPKCKGVAYRLAHYRCTACKHEFDLVLGPDAKTGKPPVFRCPKCNDPRVAPIRALEKR